MTATARRVGGAPPAPVCAHCGTTTSCAYRRVDGKWICSWCHTMRTRLLPERQRAPR